MNKLTMLIILVIAFGLIATRALAGDDLSASDFFYSESIDNTVEVINESGLQERACVITQSVELSASEFFYGHSVIDLAGAINTSDLQQRSDASTQLNVQLTPDIFYGYSDVNTVSDKCADC